LPVIQAQSEALDVESALAVALRHGKEECMSPRNGRAFLIALTIFVLSVATELYPADKTGLEPSRDSIIRIVTPPRSVDLQKSYARSPNRLSRRALKSCGLG
jgi:hypothetical protein